MLGCANGFSVEFFHLLRRHHRDGAAADGCFRGRMRLFDSVLNGLRRRYFRREFDLFCRRVLQTAPVQLGPASGPVVLSQSYHADLYMYLVAVKSFARFVRPAFFVIVDDGLDATDRALIQHHLQQVEFVDRPSVKSAECPVGGCWERLLTISDYNSDHYVIQLDSDTVTLSDPVDVRRHIQNHASFTLPTRLGRDFVSVADASRAVSDSTSTHVQVLAEKAFASIPDLQGDSYIRGCAGFAGFAKGSVRRETVERFSGLMRRALGDELWRRWGSEQVSSNYMVANSPSKGVLPFDAYPYLGPDVDLSRASLVHFIGEYRFSSAAYRRHAIRAIAEM